MLVNTHASRLRAALMTARGDTCEVIIYSRPPQAVSVEVQPPSEQDAAVIAAFDWSDASDEAWREDQKPERKAIRQAAAGALSDNNTFLAIATPTNAQNAAQIKRLTQQMNAVIRRLIQLD